MDCINTRSALSVIDVGDGDGASSAIDVGGGDRVSSVIDVGGLVSH